MAPVVFKDLLKAANDLLDKSHVANKKVSFKTTTSSKVAVSGEASVNYSNATKKDVNASKVGFKFPTWEAGAVTVSKFDVTNLGRIDVEAETKPVDDLKLTVKLSTGPNDQVDEMKGSKYSDAGSINAEYSQSNFIATLALDATNYNPSASFNSLGLLLDDVIAGGSIAFDVTKKELSDFETGFGYKSKDTTSTFITSKKCKVFTFAHEHTVSDSLSLAAVAKHSLESIGKNKEVIPSSGEFSLGGSYKYDKDAKVNFKISNDRSLKLSHVSNIRGGVELTVSTVFDSSVAWQSTGFGLAFNF